ncbi:hypothetical protein D3C72_2242560 [compost metagenome]
MSIAWVYCCRTSPRALMPFGQAMIIGSAVPPSWLTKRFHSLNGVLKAIAQPVG